jgi:low affinity Fe/Cu permease
LSERQRAHRGPRNGEVPGRTEQQKPPHRFSAIARTVSDALGSASAFLAACALVVLWMVTGPLFGFSDGWQLVINTGTTIVTFLMVFLIQNTQNHDSRALHLKLDELIRSIHAARNGLIDLESCTDEELDRLQGEFERLKGRSRASQKE